MTTIAWVYVFGVTAAALALLASIVLRSSAKKSARRDKQETIEELELSYSTLKGRLSDLEERFDRKGKRDAVNKHIDNLQAGNQGELPGISNSDRLDRKVEITRRARVMGLRA